MSNNATLSVIENREHLVSLLAEAAEIEHNLMCCYLYAAFSLKQGVDEDLSEVEFAAVQRWRGEILRVSLDEMTHLTLVSNLMAGLGGVPHFARANFPVAAGYHPAGITVKLAPFNWETLDHFIYLERPETALDHDGAGFEPQSVYRRIAIPDRLMPTSHDYQTVGELYRALDEGLERLAKELGEGALFIGNPEHQLGPEVLGLPGVTRVRCLKTARAALNGIVVQGEGAPGNSADSHYQRFLNIRKEFAELRSARPSFTPGRHAAHNPVMRHPPTPEARIWVELQPAASLLDLANATYTHMLRLLAQAYAETRGQGIQRALVDAATDLMHAIAPVASALTRLPASERHPGCTAGMSFATVRTSSALPAGAVADKVLIERTQEIATHAQRLSADLPASAQIPEFLAQIAARLAKDLPMTDVPDQSSSTSPVQAAPTNASLPANAASAVPTSVVIDGVESVEGRDLTLRFESKRCIHARHCVLGQPNVFKANVQGPWLDPDATSAEAMATVAHLCPSGAISYVRKDGGANEAVPPVNLLQLRENGPLGMRGELMIEGNLIGYRATLCRCGASQNKPFCDGSHNSSGFTASGEPLTQPSEPLAQRNGPLDIRPQRNGPLLVRGNLELCAGTGRTLNRVTEVRLCRCGGSSNKPYCDGTHARIGFKSE